MTAKKADEDDSHRQRATLMTGNLVALAISVVIWLGVDQLLAPLAGMADPLSRLIIALGCCSVATLLCLISGIEAVAHERLVTPAIDPLAGLESPRMKVNLRYLQNTLEQLAAFIPGLLMLAVYSPDGRAMRAVVATTVVWILSRFAFWIGYHQGSQYRAIGLTGMVQSMLVLLYVCYRFGYDLAGPVGAATPLVLFGLIEAYLVLMARKPSP
jgi:hypothetical protein